MNANPHADRGNAIATNAANASVNQRKRDINLRRRAKFISLHTDGARNLFDRRLIGSPVDHTPDTSPHHPPPAPRGCRIRIPGTGPRV